MTVRFRRLRLWWLQQHVYSRCWMWCQDCRWAQQAWAKGEFYAHDDPMWYIKAILRRDPDFVTEPVEIIAAPTGPNISMRLDGTCYPTPQTSAGGPTRVWLK